MRVVNECECAVIINLFLEVGALNVGPAAAGPAAPVPTALQQLVSQIGNSENSRSARKHH